MKIKYTSFPYLVSLSPYFLLVITLFSSCLSVKRETNKSNKKLFETFFVGSEGTQYYIKPLKLNIKGSTNQLLLVDFTFRYKNQVKDSTIINFSIFNNTIIQKIDSINIDNCLYSKNLQLVFKEREKDIMISRFTVKSPLKDLVLLFNKKQWYFTVYSQGKIFKFTSTKKTNNNIQKIKTSIFSLME